MATIKPEDWSSHENDNDTFTYCGEQFYVSADTGEHCFNCDPEEGSAPGTLRFEVRSGDRVQMDRYTDPETSERSEITQAHRRDFPQHFNGEFDIYVEPGPTVTSRWTSFFQLHSGMNKSGPIDMGPRGGDKFSVVVRNDGGEKVYISKSNIPRGKWLKLKIDVQQGNNGHANVWLDQEKVCSFTGQVGYGNQETAHACLGIYRDEASETLAIRFRNPKMVWGSQGHNVEPPAPIGPAPEPPDTTPPVTSGGWETVAVGQPVTIASGRLVLPIPSAKLGDLIVSQMLKNKDGNEFTRPAGWTGYPEFAMVGGQLIGGFIELKSGTVPTSVTYERSGGTWASGHITVFRKK